MRQMQSHFQDPIKDFNLKKPHINAKNQMGSPRWIPFCNMLQCKAHILSLFDSCLSKETNKFFLI